MRAKKKNMSAATMKKKRRTLWRRPLGAVLLKCKQIALIHRHDRHTVPLDVHRKRRRCNGDANHNIVQECGAHLVLGRVKLAVKRLMEIKYTTVRRE